MIIVDKMQERLESFSHDPDWSIDPDYGKTQTWVLLTIQGMNHLLQEKEHSVYFYERPFNKISNVWYWVKMTADEALYYKNPKTYHYGRKLFYDRVKNELLMNPDFKPETMF